MVLSPMNQSSPAEHTANKQKKRRAISFNCLVSASAAASKPVLLYVLEAEPRHRSTWCFFSSPLFLVNQIRILLIEEFTINSEAHIVVFRTRLLLLHYLCDRYCNHPYPLKIMISIMHELVVSIRNAVHQKSKEWLDRGPRAGRSDLTHLYHFSDDRTYI